MFMKNKRNGFTLMELLAVVVILGITFLFIMPSVTSLMGLGERREIELIEERVLSAAKEYVNNYDSTFYNSFYKEGDTNYVYKSDLINAGLIDKNEISKLNTFAGVKGELLSNDRIRYTVEYINASNNEYTNEELYLMMQNMNKNIENNTNKINNMNNNGGENSEIIENLQNQINEHDNKINSNATSISNLTDKDNVNNVFLQTYPVGSIFVTNESTNPGSIFGGTWVTYGEGRTLVGVDSTQTEFATVGKTGGTKTHTLTINEMPSHSGHLYGSAGEVTGVGNAKGAWLYQMTTHDVTHGYGWDYANNEYYPANQSLGGSKAHNNLQPYITVYMWKRTA